MYEKNPDRTRFFTASLTIQGKGGHSSVPYKTRNPILPAFTLLQVTAEKLLYEFTSFQNVALIPLSFDAGSQQNIIPDTASLTLRGEAANPEDSEKLKAVLTGSISALEALYQVTISSKFEDYHGQN